MFIQTGFVFLLIFLIGIDGARRRCVNTGALLPDKIMRSPIVVYGEPTAKRIYVDTDTQLLFNISFRVDCIFKGQNIENRIEITDAGIKTGHTACQWLDPGKSYVVFLEKWGMANNAYRPIDFQELVADDMTFELLQKTCHLARRAPLNTSSYKCPNVSMIEFCPFDKSDIQNMPKSGRTDFNMQSPFDGSNQFQLQQNVTVTKQGTAFAINKHGDASRNQASPSVGIPLISTMIIAIIMIV